jgi:hypothetical protein|tara:strand:+ start:2313 stop:2948 length:636 start_codon:yes stop_codon:yes gene_type:complete
MSVESGYRITVAGQYFVREGEKRLNLKSYKFDINMPTMDSALSVIKNKILDVVLKKKYPDYVSYRTHQIMNVVAFGDVAQQKAVLWQMNRTTILSYIQENELPVEPEIFETLMELREAVQMAEADPDNFIKVQDAKRKDWKILSGLRALNPDLFPKPEEETEEQDMVKETGSSWKADPEEEKVNKVRVPFTKEVVATKAETKKDALSELMA